MREKIELTHITHKEYALKIIENGFNKSLHDIKIPGTPYTTNQWLGDGVYFFEYNNEQAEELGIDLVSGKLEFTEARPFIYASINVKLKLNRDKIVNLLDDDDFDDFQIFVQGLINNRSKDEKRKRKLLYDFEALLNALKNREPLENSKTRFLGHLMNDFVSAASSDIDIVCMGFYRSNKEKGVRKTKILGDIPLEPINQYCVKNLDLISKEKLKLCLE